MADQDEGTDAEHVGYESPTIERLGTLADLTAGVTGGLSDGAGSGSIPGGGIPGG